MKKYIYRRVEGDMAIKLNRWAYRWYRLASGCNPRLHISPTSVNVLTNPWGFIRIRLSYILPIVMLIILPRQLYLLNTPPRRQLAILRLWTRCLLGSQLQFGGVKPADIRYNNKWIVHLKTLISSLFLRGLVNILKLYFIKKLLLITSCCLNNAPLDS